MAGAARSRYTALSVALVVALGTGTAMALLAVWHDVFVGSAPFPDEDQLVVLENRGAFDLGVRKVETPQMSWPDYRDISAEERVFAALGAITRPELTTWDAGDRWRTVWRVSVDEQLLPLLGVRAQRGRSLTDADFQPGAPLVALITEGLWRRQLGSRPDVVGRQVKVDDVTLTLIGVVADDVVGFLRERTILFNEQDQDRCVITPMVPGAAGRREPLLALRRLNRGRPVLTVVGRLRTGVAIQTAQQDVRRTTERLSEQYPATNRGRSTVVTRLAEWRTRQVQHVRGMLLAVAGLALMVACASAVGLIAADAIRREGEMCVRHALGATSGRLGRLILRRSLQMTLPGGLIGLVLAYGALSWLGEGSSGSRPVSLQLLGPTLLLGAAGLAALSGLALALVSVLVLRSQNLSLGLREAGHATLPSRRRRRILGLVVTIQMAAGMSLGLVSGLLIRSMINVMRVDLGFDAGSTFIVRIFLPETRYETAEAQSAFFNDVLTRVRSLPGVVTAGLSNTPPLSRAVATAGGFELVVPGRPPNALGVLVTQFVSPGYFESVGMRLSRGRGFSEDDYQSDGGVAVVDEAFSRAYLHAVDPLEATIRVPGRRYQIIGILTNVHQDGPAEAARATLYLLRDKRHAEGLFAHLVVKPSSAGTMTMNDVVQEIVRIDQQAVVDDPQTLGALFARTVADRRRTVRLLTLAATVVFLLTAFSISGALNELVENRTRELALRRALGASARQTATLLIGQVAIPGLAGIAAGSAGGWMLARTLSSELFGVQATDPATAASTLVALALVALGAAAGPIRQALGIKPAEALRAQ